MTRRLERGTRRATAGAIAVMLLVLTMSAHADGDRARREAPPPPTVYRDECGSCHVAYPARLMPAASWQHLLGRLGQHFGADASMEPAAAREIAAWLAAQAATRGKRSEAPPDDRITRAGWFQREHREIATAVWQRPSIQRPSNCSACHAQAERGDFDEHQVRIPR